MSKSVWESAAFVFVVAVLVVLFGGEPDIADALRAKALEWAGLEVQNE